MQPLEIVAEVPGQVAMPHGPIALDALLMAQRALLDGMPPAAFGQQAIGIPVEREPGGRFHLCSHSVGELTDYDLRYVNQRAPLEQYQLIGPKTGRVQITSGPDKSYRIPIEVGHLKGARLTWWCIGEREKIAALLATVTHLGKKRSVGLGRVASWSVEPCEPWDGFPVVREGAARPPLPADWPGLSDPDLAYGKLTPPYWDRASVELVAVPGRSH